MRDGGGVSVYRFGKPCGPLGARRPTKTVMRLATSINQGFWALFVGFLVGLWNPICQGSSVYFPKGVDWVSVEIGWGPFGLVGDWRGVGL